MQEQTNSLREIPCSDECTCSSKLYNSQMASATRIDCFGTAWVRRIGTTGVAPEAGAPRFSSPRLDTSVLMKLHMVLDGMTFSDLAAGTTSLEFPEGPVRRTGGSPFTAKRTFHIYECSEEFCRLLADLTPERIELIAGDWVRLTHGRMVLSESPSAGRTKHLKAVLTQFTELAKTAAESGGRLTLRVDYRARQVRSE
jgi:hypothetical protein